MLVELCIRDLALIEKVDLCFGPGLGVITGETGAGKSLLVGALEFLLGERPRGDIAGWVRDGAEHARVEGRFTLSGASAARVRERIARELPALADELDVDDELLLGRTLSRDGRTRAHLDHRPIALKSLRALAPVLIEIHGQNDHQRLLEPAEQLRLVDSFGGLADELATYRALRARWLLLAERVLGLDRERAERIDRLEYLRFRVAELQRAAPEPGEKAALVGERAILRDAAAIRSELGGLGEALSESDEALLDRLRQAERLVGRWRARIDAIAPVADELCEAVLHLEEACASLASFVDGVEDDPARLELVEGRLADVEKLEERFGVGADELGGRRAVMQTELDELARAEQGADGLADELETVRAELATSAGRLAQARRALGPRLAQSVCARLDELGLGKARFELDVAPRERAPSPNEKPADLAERIERDRRLFGSRGTDAVEFRLAANPGEPMRPLRHVASGGEAARIMLALRGVLASCDQGRTLVFDEIDAGVGGRLGPAVGEHLRALGEHHQVLCVTHLPAIAAAAATHLCVRKRTARERTCTEVARLDGDERAREIADMIAGGADEATARAEARRLLESGAARTASRPPQSGARAAPAEGASADPPRATAARRPERASAAPDGRAAKRGGEAKGRSAAKRGGEAKGGSAAQRGGEARGRSAAKRGGAAKGPSASKRGDEAHGGAGAKRRSPSR